MLKSIKTSILRSLTSSLTLAQRARKHDFFTWALAAIKLPYHLPWVPIFKWDVRRLYSQFPFISSIPFSNPSPSSFESAVELQFLFRLFCLLLKSPIMLLSFSHSAVYTICCLLSRSSMSFQAPDRVSSTHRCVLGSRRFGSQSQLSLVRIYGRAEGDQWLKPLRNMQQDVYVPMPTLNGCSQSWRERTRRTRGVPVDLSWFLVQSWRGGEVSRHVI